MDCQPNNPTDKATYLAELAAFTPAHSVYIDCPDTSGITLSATINAGRVYFHGFIKGGNLHMPNATQVYVDNTNDSGRRVNANAISLSNGDTFCVRAASPARPTA